MYAAPNRPATYHLRRSLGLRLCIVDFVDMDGLILLYVVSLRFGNTVVSYLSIVSQAGNCMLLKYDADNDCFI